MGSAADLPVGYVAADQGQDDHRDQDEEGISQPVVTVGAHDGS